MPSDACTNVFVRGRHANVRITYSYRTYSKHLTPTIWCRSRSDRLSRLGTDTSTWQTHRQPHSHVAKATAIIGVNAAGVAGVATPPIFDLQGSSCVDDPPPIFWQVFDFFLSAELLNTASSCHFHLQCTPQFFEHNYWFIYWFFATCSAIDTNSYQ